MFRIISYPVFWVHYMLYRLPNTCRLCVFWLITSRATVVTIFGAVLKKISKGMAVIRTLVLMTPYTWISKIHFRISWSCIIKALKNDLNMQILESEQLVWRIFNWLVKMTSKGMDVFTTHVLMTLYTKISKFHFRTTRFVSLWHLSQCVLAHY